MYYAYVSKRTQHTKYTLVRAVNAKTVNVNTAPGQPETVNGREGTPP